MNEKKRKNGQIAKIDPGWWGQRQGHESRIIYLKSKNDSPNKTKNDSMISINNIMISNILHRNFLFVQKIDCSLHIFKSMDSHFASSIWNFLKNG